MLRKKKKKHTLPQVEVNIISLMDVLTTLLFFILMVTSFTKYSVLDASSMSSGEPSDDKKNVFSLKITINNKKSSVVYLGPVRGVKMVNEKALFRFLRRNGFKGNQDAGFTRKIWGKDYEKNLKRMQKYLIGIKKAFPHEFKAVLALSDKVEYQKMIDAMSKLRTLGDEEDAFVYETLVGQKEKTRILFPQVIIAEK
jgi:biopolymer transport protein ExbD